MYFEDIVVLDTNILITYPKALLKFENKTVVIPSVVLEELDKLKTGLDRNARRMSRLASNLIDTVTRENEDKPDIPLGNGSYLIIEREFTREFPTSEPDKPDNMIISAAVGYARKGHKVIMYSNDTNVRNITRSLAKTLFADKMDNLPLLARDYEVIDSSLHDIDSGVKDLFLPDEEVIALRRNGYHAIDLPYLNGEHLIVRAENNPDKNTALAYWDSIQKRILTLQDFKKGEPVWTIGGSGIQGTTPVRPRDARQSFLAHDLLDTSKSLHFVVSRVAGAGKNFIATACALNLLQNGLYDRLIMVKPMIAVEGSDTGYLPGTKDEKMAPWFESFNDTITELTNDRGLGGDLEARIELDIVTHMRGRSIPRTIMIIDEAQNFSEEALKTLGTRAGEDAKIILMGDLSQIDNLRLDAGNSGLRVWADRSRNIETGYADSTYILLDSNFRSPLSAWFSSFYE